MRDKLLKRLSRRLLQLEKETRYPAHPPASPAEAYVSDVMVPSNLKYSGGEITPAMVAFWAEKHWHSQPEEVKSCYAGLAEKLTTRHREEVQKWTEARKTEGCAKFREMEDIRKKLGAH